MKRASLILMIVMMAIPFSTFAQKEETGLYVGDVSNSGCKSQTRGESVRGHTIPTGIFSSSLARKGG